MARHALMSMTHLDWLRKHNPSDALSAGGCCEAATVGVVRLVGGKKAVHSKADRVWDGGAILHSRIQHMTSAHACISTCLGCKLLGHTNISG